MNVMTSATLTPIPSASNGIMPSTYTYCGPGLLSFRKAFQTTHGYLCLFVCLFGSVANSLNIAILTRREMRSPTNLILTGLAVADLLVMLEYIPYVCHSYLSPFRSRMERYTYGWSMFVLVHSIFTQVFHTISIWLTVTLAVWRYIAIAYPQKNREWCNMESTKAAVLGAYIVCPLICMPLYFSFSLIAKVESFTPKGEKYINTTAYNMTIDGPLQNATVYFVQFSSLAERTLLKDLDFYLYSVVIKIIPCVALTILSTRLIIALIETKKRRRLLSTNTTIPLTKAVKPKQSTIYPGQISKFENDAEESQMMEAACEVKTSKKKNARLLDKEKQTDRTSRMLLAVLLLFLITEFPQGILGVLSVIFGVKFFMECYVNLGEIMDILALVNSAINFILYCAMSRQFRTTFKTVFSLSRLPQQWLPVALHPNTKSYNGNGNTTANTQVTQV